MSKGIVPAPSQTRPQTPADVLRAAALRIEPEGAWGQGAEGQGFPPYGTACACMAVVLSARAHGRTAADWFVPALALAKALGDDGGKPDHAIRRWNDAPERTQAEVVAKLREVADSLDPPPANPEIGGEG